MIWWQQPNSSTGGQLGVDANPPCGSNHTPLESVFWPMGTAPRGSLEFWVRYFETCDDSTSQAFQIEIRRGAYLVLTQGGWVNDGNESSHYRYTY